MRAPTPPPTFELSERRTPVDRSNRTGSRGPEGEFDVSKQGETRRGGRAGWATRGRPSHSTVAAYVALFVALGGTGAWAADKITSKEIAKNAVRSKHIKTGQVKAADLGKKAVKATKLANNAVGVAQRAPTPHARVSRSPDPPTGLPVPSGGFGLFVGFNREDFDTGNMWTSGPPDRLRIRTPGTYLLTGQVTWQSGQGGGAERLACVEVLTAALAFRDNDCRRDEPHTEWTQPQRLSLVSQLAAGDIVRFFLSHDRGTTAHVLDPELAAVWLGPR